MNVPLLDLNPQHLALEGELQAAFARVLRSGQFILGGAVEALERELAAYLGVEPRRVLGVSSGTDALVLALMALGIGPGDEVLCPSFTFFATAGSVARLGATPVFVDSEPGTFNLDVADLERKITPRAKAVIPVHLFGRACDMAGVLRVARERGLRVVEDAAQSLGARSGGRASGTEGDFGAYSFFPTKNLGALGDAGLLVAGDDALAEKARILRVHGAHPKYYHRHVGGNFRIDALQAALLSVKLPHCDAYCARRVANTAYYAEKLGALPGIAGRITLPEAAEGSIWNQYTLRVHGTGVPAPRDRLQQALQRAGVGSEIYYPVPLHLQECFRGLGGKPGDLPVSETLAREVLSIPIYPELAREQQDHVVAAIAAFLKEGA